jgi:ribonucleoside-diphosphate reductase alpha chain
MEFYTEFAEKVFTSKYLHPSDEGKIKNAVGRVVDKSVTYIDPGVIEPSIYRRSLHDAIDRQCLVPAGGIWRAAGNTYKHVSFVNCTTGKNVEDNIESIFESLYYWAKFSAFGQGQGIDISLLRPAGTRLRNTARTSTGGVSFMPLYDAVMKVIAQQGRRGATLISIHDTYPDFEEFCRSKNEKGAIESANISIQVTDAFMRAVDDDGDWRLYWEGEGDLQVEKIVKARRLFEVVCEQAWKTGDPGFLYWDTSREQSNSDALGFPIVCTNACSEVPQDAHNTCLLSSLSLWKIYQDEGNLNEETIRKYTRLGTLFLDTMLEAEWKEERSPSPVQRGKLRMAPRIGLGFTGFADYLILKRIPYGSQESIDEVERITSSMAYEAHKTSFDLARAKGSFEAYDKEKFKKSGYIQAMLKEGVIDEEMLIAQRHMCKLAIAPAGTLSIISNCGGSGIEPLFSKYMVRRERSTTEGWKEWFIYSAPVIREATTQSLNEVTREFADSLQDPWWVTAHDVDLGRKISVVAAAQKYIDQGISVTHNLPEEATVEDVRFIYQQCWQWGLKGATVYREGCRGEAVLITERNYEKARKAKKRTAIPRPLELEGRVFRYRDYTMIIGLKNGKPYEVFGGTVSNGFQDGMIRKEASRTYLLNGQNILDHFHDQSVNAITRLVSLSLRHGVPLQFVCDQLNKEADMFAATKFFSRILRKYIDESEEVLGSHHHCQSCGAGPEDLKYEGGCEVCVKCGSSSCS